MFELQTPDTEHAEFDELCLEIEDYEPLPSIPTSEPLGTVEHSETIEAEILAGLVTP